MLLCRQSPCAKKTLGVFLVLLGVFAATQGIQARTQLTLMEERDAAAVLCDGRVLFRIRYRGPFASCEERARVILKRLQEVFSSAWKSPPTFYLVREKGGALSAFCGGKRLFSIFREDASLNASNPLDLAVVWLNNVQLAFYGVSERTCGVTKEFDGLASFCHPKFDGRKTASGEVYSSYAFTAAHRTLPIGSVLLVTNPENKRQVVVKVNDRGPWKRNRAIDLSLVAAKVLGIEEEGVSKVRVEVIAWQKR
ncbi:MAG: septal ring lytic transglycosylase RlpA family protein [Candidatus Caldatribacterium sp.]|uniref:septal ring lytic transglycosylase RlpA family protein n=1 Tax=Candidatus Caldatribacterium sp. TaxID=2282143 RepID=UPI00299ACDA7|nr:septal ring lytic transglycosylase RlpA family protein [Candidatus Caldatribacterium sp.]MCX7731053.1 septal ring lytic transglycosylase RlpA family protein [Candidatus Caldatribacterium sp.]MDW8080310.1 septal ring lytic transglycosylase RlpA family protein [Candidatus Calescibacterium sp.]